MQEFIFLMHGDSGTRASDADWKRYIEELSRGGHFRGGSAIGHGECVRKTGAAPDASPLSGYIRVQAEDLERAKLLLAGNPVFEGGGTVEIRALPQS